jgi:acetolactate synthase-1/2/3 large subunit
MVNIDLNELQKTSFVPDLPVHADVKWFVSELISKFNIDNLSIDNRWMEVCQYWKEKYPTVTPDYLEDKAHVNSYIFAQRLSEFLNPGAVLVTGNSLDIVSVYHSFNIKTGQRVFTNINFGAMGWDLPAAVGACVGNDRKETILVTGDGTIQFNVQELNTISYNHLPVKIFIQNNEGYASIRTTQESYFGGNFIGSDVSSGIGNPDFCKLAESFGFPYFKINNNEEISSILKLVFGITGPVICELNLSYTQGRSPRIVSVKHEDGRMESKPLEDQFPFISREELYQNMHLFNQ